ncbi:uncharacterized protein [Halyomorpha halys]|nr:uncharacterized protein LOC106686346 isoform X2 [Halyomorpha halys]XP_014285068.1 uncharacterized protein LOC106686346 isoform X2 [Halyomorpha halys]
MDYLEGMSWRSPDSLRQWFKKLQCIFPGNFTRNNLAPKTTKLLQLKRQRIGSGVFNSQENLDVIMHSLRRDLVNLLRKSESNYSITLLIYKLNMLDNNIREICRFQFTWINQPYLNMESLKAKEKDITRLIEEIMDEVYDAHSSMRRRANHFPYNERNINSIISVLGVLKREVCNMIFAIITSIQHRQKSKIYGTIHTPSNTVAGKYFEIIENSIKSPFPIESPFETKTILEQKNSKSSQVSLHSNKSYPFLERSNGRIFSSLQNICCGFSGSQMKENSDYFNRAVREDIAKDNCHFFINDNNTNGRGDADENTSEKNGITFREMQEDSVQLSSKDEDNPGISKTLSAYIAFADKNKASLLSYNKDHSSSKNIKKNCGTFYIRKNCNQEQEDTRAYLFEKRSSRLSWPSATVVRGIKSEMNLDGSVSYNRLGRNEIYKDYYSEDNISESDSDESYISCAFDDFQLERNFLDHIKEKYLPEKLYKKTPDTGRNNTKSFSCKSPKLSEIFTGPVIIERKESCVPEVYHSVESLAIESNCTEEGSNNEKMVERKNTDRAIGTKNGMDLKALGYKKHSSETIFDKNEPLKVHSALMDSFKTLALSEDYGGNDAMYAESIVSLASIATETEEGNDKDSASLSSYKSLQQRPFQYIVDSSPTLEDSQYSAICLALPPSSIRMVTIGNEINLLAIEVDKIEGRPHST